MKLILTEENQLLVSINWNWVDVGSKKKSSATQKLSIRRDQKSEKLRIRLIFVLSKKVNTKQPNNGIQIMENNILRKHVQWDSNSCQYTECTILSIKIWT
jgi:hypothetical protein